MNYSLKQTEVEGFMPEGLIVKPEEYDSYLVAKNYFDLKEYDR